MVLEITVKDSEVLWKSRTAGEHGIAGSRRTVYAKTLLSVSARPSRAHRKRAKWMVLLAMMSFVWQTRLR